MIICTVFDSASETYAQPFFIQTVGAAIRSFGDEANRADSQINQHADDFTLHKVGTWDYNTGTIEPQRPQLLARAKDLIVKG